MRRFWTAKQVATLRELYPHMLAAKLAKRLRITLKSVYTKAHKLGLHKSPEFMASDASGRLTKFSAAGASHRFKKGTTPWNLGKRGYMSANRTSFRKGNKPHTWRPIGAERITKDGLLQRKVTDTGYTPRDWKAVHTLVWEETHGKVPRGHIVVFKDGNRRNFEPPNLECITRAENMRRNTYHRYPKEIALTIQLRGALQRQINKRGKNEQHRGSS